MPKSYELPKPNNQGAGSKLVPTPKVPQEQRVTFSFKYLARKTGKFDYEAIDEATYFHQIAERLKNLSAMTRREVHQSSIYNYKALRCHPIKWSDTGVSEASFGIPGDITDEAFQISVSKALGRIHGFFTGDVFNIVWLDKEHQLIDWTEA